MFESSPSRASNPADACAVSAPTAKRAALSDAHAARRAVLRRFPACAVALLACLHAAAAFAAARPPAPQQQLVISEFTPRGPLGPLDEFIEVFNNTDLPHTVNASDASAGYAIAAEDGIPRCTIPNGTVIPARGHFLCAGAQYIYTSDVPPDAFFFVNPPTFGDIGDQQGLALFDTSNPASFTVLNRLDAFGYTTSPALYREGAGFPFVVVANAPRSYVRTQYSAYEKDTDDNAADFISVNARLDVCCDPNSVLGMAGPQNLASPINRGAATPMSLFDPNAVGGADDPTNREPGTTAAPVCQSGTNVETIRFRRRITNKTGELVTSMRIRVIEITTLQSPTALALGKASPCLAPSCADLRVLSSSSEPPITTVSFGPQPTSGMTLELAGYQSICGAYNSSLHVDTGPVPDEGFVNVNILVAMLKPGAYRFFVTVEVLPQP